MKLLSIESDQQDPFYAHSLYVGDDTVGMVTSGGYGYRSQKTLAMAYLSDPEKAFEAHQGKEQPLEIRLLNKRYQAVILDDIPFDPENARLKS